MIRTRRLALLLGLALLAGGRAASAQLPSTNPFAAPSPLLYHAPDFTKIRVICPSTWGCSVADEPSMIRCR